MRTLHLIHTLTTTAACLLIATSAQAAWVSYHDLGATTGFESTGNITTHQSGTGSAVALDTGLKDLIRFSDGSDTGVDFSIAGANAMDARNAGETAPPAAATDADALFNVAGLNLDNGIIYEGGNGGDGATTFSLYGLNPGQLYDIAFYGHRSAGADGDERFTLGGADSATNSSSAGTIVSTFVSDWETRPNAAAGNVVRWTDIAPGADGKITITMDPEVSSLSNVAYATAVRLEDQAGDGSFAGVHVDLGRSDGAGTTGAGPSQAPQLGWEEWLVAGTQGTMNQSKSFTFDDATDGTVDVTMTSNGNTFARNYNNTITGEQDGFQNLLEDKLFINNSQSGANFIEFQFDDLKAGVYKFTGYHHFVQLNTGFATVDILLNGADTGLDVQMDDHASPFLIDELRLSQIVFAVANDNDAITIRFANPDAAIFGLNGFQLVTIPTPAALPAGIAMLGLAAMRRRRMN